MQAMEQSQGIAIDAAYANGYPDVGFDQDASVHLHDVRSNISALKVKYCSELPNTSLCL
jgi:hypothetical protein